jgi:hypothetical protein
VLVEVLPQDRGQLRRARDNPHFLGAAVLQLARLTTCAGLAPRASRGRRRRAQVQLTSALDRDRQCVLPQVHSLRRAPCRVVHAREERDKAPPPAARGPATPARFPLPPAWSRPPVRLPGPQPRRGARP